MNTAVLLMAHGTPDSIDEMEPYLRNVMKHRPPTPAFVAEIQSRFSAPVAPPSTAGGDFAALLDSAQTATAGGVSGAGSTRGATGKGESGGQYAQFAEDLLGRLGMPQTAENVRAIVAWARAEGTDAANNPLATTQPWEGDSRFNSVGVRNYASYEDGLEASVRTLRNGRYGNILSALSAGNSADAVARAVADSPWGTGDGVLRVLASGTA